MSNFSSKIVNFHSVVLLIFVDFVLLFALFLGLFLGFKSVHRDLFGYFGETLDKLVFLFLFGLCERKKNVSG